MSAVGTPSATASASATAATVPSGVAASPLAGPTTPATGRGASGPNPGGPRWRHPRELLRAGAELIGRVRTRAATPPGRLRFLSILLILALLVLWVAAFTTMRSRQHAVADLQGDSGASFIAAQSLHADLSTADATVARAFLAGGVEPPDQRAAYASSIDAAGNRIVDLSRAAGPQRQLTTIATELPVYTGLVERARANNRLGLVVGGAYLRQASELMQGTILPAVDEIAATDAERIDRGFADATRWYHPLLVTVIGLVVFAALLVTQIRLFRRTHRILNPPLVAAALLTVVAAGLTLGAFGQERSRLLDGRDTGYVPMTINAQARVLGLRAWGDESLSLIARGNGADSDADAAKAVARLGYDSRGRPTGAGVLPATSAASEQRDSRATLDADWRAYQATSLRVRGLVSGVGGFQDAVTLALGDGTTTFTRFNDAAAEAFTSSQTRFTTRLSAAGDAFGGLAVGVTVALGLAVALTLVGLQSRINDYR